MKLPREQYPASCPACLKPMVTQGLAQEVEPEFHVVDEPASGLHGLTVAPCPWCGRRVPSALPRKVSTKTATGDWGGLPPDLSILAAPPTPTTAPRIAPMVIAPIGTTGRNMIRMVAHATGWTCALCRAQVRKIGETYDRFKQGVYECGCVSNLIGDQPPPASWSPVISTHAAPLAPPTLPADPGVTMQALLSPAEIANMLVAGPMSSATWRDGGLDIRVEGATREEMKAISSDVLKSVRRWLNGHRQRQRGES